MRETTKEITLPAGPDGSRWRLRKMNAMDGSWLLKLLLEKLLPELKGGADRPLTDLLPGLLSRLSEEEFRRVMTLCLTHTDLSLPAGWTPVMDGSGFAVEAPEYDAPLCLALCWQGLVFNCGGFFGEGGFLSLRPREDPPTA